MSVTRMPRGGVNVKWVGLDVAKEAIAVGVLDGSSESAPRLEKISHDEVSIRRESRVERDRTSRGHRRRNGPSLRTIGRRSSERGCLEPPPDTFLILRIPAAAFAAKRITADLCSPPSRFGERSVGAFCTTTMSADQAVRRGSLFAVRRRSESVDHRFRRRLLGRAACRSVRVTTSGTVRSSHSTLCQWRRHAR